MRSRLSRLSMLLFWVFGLVGLRAMPLRDSLVGSLEVLRGAGWRIPDAGVVSAGDSVEITATGGERRQILLDVPVEVGKYYCGSVMVKAEGVLPRDNADRGATLFFGFLDSEREWVNGGEFPRGALQTTDWQKVAITSTIAVPAQVRFIQVWLCVEGQGKAWFRDFEMMELELETQFSIDASANPPTLHSSAPLMKGAKDNLRRRVLLSPDPSFPASSTLEFMTGQEVFTPPHALVPGIWHVRNCWTHRRGDLPVQGGTFTAAALPAGYAVRVTRDFPNGVFAPRAELKVRFYPPLAVGSLVEVTIDEAPVEVVSRAASEMSFRPGSDLAPGCYRVKVVLDGKATELLYVNKNPAAKITFRDDLVMLIDGKPFFPVGTYRDPSDELHTFTGIKEAGFNFTHSYYFEHAPRQPEEARAYLRDCVKNGVTACIGIPRKHMQNERFDAIEAFCGEVYDEPGLVTWYLADEPELWINRFNFRDSTAAVASAGRGIPRTLLMCTTNPKSEINQFFGAGLSDIYWHDPYPVGRHPIASMVKALENSRLLASPEQPLWAVIQAFDWRQKKVRELPPEDVEPKAGKIRCMTHLALATGVQGIVFYWLPKDRYDMRLHSPIQWAEVCSTTQELNGLMPFLVGRSEKLPAGALPEGVYYWQKRAEDGRRALAIVNPEAKAVVVELNIQGMPASMTLPPHGVEVKIY
ncbi:MAG: hypothetical protein PHC30_05440 [Lentisphaeria bacterium]|nr:hypothetical protein [Lentisphaeria bacterium]